jgi:hypothetical protein
MKTFFYLSLLLSSLTFALPPTAPDNKTINIQNTILATVNGKTISVLDLKEKMDLLFHKSYPDLINSNTARHQFYTSGWKTVLSEMINTELMVFDAQKREIKLEDSEVREEMERRFGPNIMVTLDEIGIPYEKTWKLIKREMIVQRMSWFFVHSKALQRVTPQLIRKNYRLFLEKNPPLETWNYKVISIKTTDENLAKELAEKIYSLTKKENFEKKFEEIKKSNENVSLNISKEYNMTSQKISDSHKKVLKTLKENSYSTPVKQISKFNKKPIYRIFHLKTHKTKNPPTFEKAAPEIKEKLLQKAAAEESKNYFNKLRKYYGFVENTALDDFNPFILK